MCFNPKAILEKDGSNSTRIMFFTWSIQSFVQKVKQFVKKYYITWLITQLFVINIALLTVLFCHCQLVDLLLTTVKRYVPIQSVCWFGMINQQSHVWFEQFFAQIFKIFEVALFLLRQFENFQKCIWVIPQIALPNMWFQTCVLQER